MEALAAEAALALERTRSAAALARVLERERLIASISRKVRSELDVDAVLRVAVTETGQALQACRCFIRLDAPGGLPIAAEWHEPGLVPIPPELATLLPVSNLAARERRTVVVADTAEDPLIQFQDIPEREALRGLGARAALATPVVVFDRGIGVLTLHRPEPGPWSAGEVTLAEAVAGELGLAIHTARLLRENERRIAEQASLLRAAQVVTSDLRLKPVLDSLVTQVAELLGADAADCFLLDSGARRAALRGRPRPAVRARRLRVPVRPGPHGAGNRGGTSRPLGGLRRGRVPARGVRRLRRRDRRTDDMGRAGARRRRCRQPRLRARLRPGRRRPARGVRQPRLAGPPQRRELRAERTAGAHPARLLSHRLGARGAAFTAADLRRARPGRGRGARRERRRRARAEAGSPRARGRVPALTGAGRRLQRARRRRLGADRRGRSASDRRRGRARGRRAVRRGLAAAGPGQRTPRGARCPVRGADDRRGGFGRGVLRGGAAVLRRRSRAGPPTGRRRPRRARAQRAVRG